MKTWVVATGLLQLSACAVDTLPIARFVEDAGDPADGSRQSGRICATNDDCAAGEYCAKQRCDDVQGTCESRPTTCDATEEPVCGCDRLVYLNACLLSLNGVSLASVGACDEPISCGRPDQPSCPSGTYCGLLLSADATHCPPEVTGKCWVLPPACGDPAGPARFRLCSDVLDGRARQSAGPDEGSDSECADLCTAIRSQRLYQRADDCSG